MNAMHQLGTLVVAESLGRSGLRAARDALDARGLAYEGVPSVTAVDLQPRPEVGPADTNGTDPVGAEVPRAPVAPLAAAPASPAPATAARPAIPRPPARPQWH